MKPAGLSPMFTDEFNKEVHIKIYINPDGTQGGLVADGAVVPIDCWIHPTSVIGPGVILQAGTIIGPDEIIEKPDQQRHCA